MSIRVNRPPDFLNRFTSLPIFLDMLSRKSITLLGPTLWEDKNDAYYLEKYKDKQNLRTLLAFCFSAKRETFHHWKVFANGPSGVCVEFCRSELINCVRKVKGIRMRRVHYLLINENTQPPLERWPFLKRRVFEDEGEFRVVYEHATEQKKSIDIPIDLNCIRKITLSPWLYNPAPEAIRKIIHRIDGCDKIKVNHSTLLDTPKWRECITRSYNGETNLTQTGC